MSNSSCGTCGGIGYLDCAYQICPECGEDSELTRDEFEDILNELGVPFDDEWENGGRIPAGEQYGTWMRRNDRIAFNCAYTEAVREEEFRRELARVPQCVHSTYN